MERRLPNRGTIKYHDLLCGLRNEINDLIVDYKLAWARWAVSLIQSPRLKMYRYHNDGHDPLESTSTTYSSIDLDEVWFDPVVEFTNALFSIPNSWFIQHNVPFETRGRIIVEVSTNPRYEPNPKDEPFASDVKAMKRAVGIQQDHFYDCRDVGVMPPWEEPAYRAQMLIDAMAIPSRFFTNHPDAQSKRSTGCPLELRSEILYMDKALIQKVAKLLPKHDFFQDVDGLRRLCRLLVEPSLANPEVLWLLKTYGPIIKGQFGRDPEELAQLYDACKNQ